MDIGQGLVIAAIGMGVVFLSLIILLFTMMALARLFRQREATREAKQEELKAREPDKEVVAAISIAMASLLEETRPERRSMRQIPSRRSSNWKILGRQQLTVFRELRRRQ